MANEHSIYTRFNQLYGRFQVPTCDWRALSSHPDMTLDVVLADLYYTPWDWGILSRHPNITFDDILAHSEAIWNWYNVSRNPNVTVDILKRYSHENWDWCGLSYNPNITMRYVLSNMDKPWNWLEVIRTLNMPLIKFLGICSRYDMNGVPLDVFICKQILKKERLVHRFIDKIRMQQNRKNQIKPIFNKCMVELTQSHMPNLGVSY